MHPEISGSPAFLPPETWLHIHRLATQDTSPFIMARFSTSTIRDPGKDIQGFLNNANSFAQVCRLWNAFANEILFENIQVNKGFNTLYAALQRPGTARLVRSVRLSTTRFDHNLAILGMCPNLKLVVQPDALSMSRSDSLVGIAESIGTAVLPDFFSLTRIYWTESYVASALLRRLVAAAPNLNHLFLSHSSALRQDSPQAVVLPPLPSLTRLGIGRLASLGMPLILPADLNRLTHLTCTPPLLILTDFPLLSAVNTLTLCGARTTVPFARIFSRCPRLQTLCYDARNQLWVPAKGAADAPLACIHLQLPANVGSSLWWATVEAHFVLFLAPEFPRVQRVVLHGGRADVIANPRWVDIRTDLQKRSCEVKFWEGDEEYNQLSADYFAP
ncbi:hypothetical protein C8R46DRAFT_1352155, partial [Mycena filopes]